MPEDDEDDFTAVASRAELTAALAKRAQHRPWIIVVSGSDAVGKMYRLERELTIGRSPKASVQLEQDGVSRLHAKLTLTPEGNVDIVDLESRNGTFVNGERVSRYSLRDGDKIQVGTASILKFSYQDALDEALQQNLYESATRDALTGAVNKKMFAETLAKEFAFAIRHRRALSIAAFDIDHFKRINDTYGHPAGDYVLQTLAKTVTACIRAEDILARVGGEEFIVVLRDIEERGALECAERIRRTIERTELVYDGHTIPVTLSIGVSAIEQGTHARPEDMVATADERLYCAKRSGRNCVVGTKRSQELAVAS